MIIICYTSIQLSGVRNEECMWLDVTLATLEIGDADPDPTILFQCPANYYMGGVRSTFDTTNVDRS